MSEKRFELSFDEKTIIDISSIKKTQYDKYEVVVLLNQLHQENQELREMIKAKALKQYRDGSLEDLQFNAIAYDDIIKIEMDYESEPTLKIYCKPNTRQNIQSFILLFVPLGVYFEIIEDDGDGVCQINVQDVEVGKLK